MDEGRGWSEQGGKKRSMQKREESGMISNSSLPTISSWKPAQMERTVQGSGDFSHVLEVGREVLSPGRGDCCVAMHSGRRYPMTRGYRSVGSTICHDPVLVDPGRSEQWLRSIAEIPVVGGWQ